MTFIMFLLSIFASALPGNILDAYNASLASNARHGYRWRFAFFFSIFVGFVVVVSVVAISWERMKSDLVWGLVVGGITLCVYFWLVGMSLVRYYRQRGDR